MQTAGGSDCSICGALKRQSAERLKEGRARPPDAARGAWFPRHHLLLTAYYATAVVWGIRWACFDERSRLDWLVPLLWSVILGWWTIMDARQRCHPIPLLARPWFVLFAPLAVPGYVIWSRRLRGVSYVVLHALGWYALSAVAMHVAGMVVYGDGWWQGLRW
jgi:hypothetical protein